MGCQMTEESMCLNLCVACHLAEADGQGNEQNMTGKFIFNLVLSNTKCVTLFKEFIIILFIQSCSRFYLVSLLCSSWKEKNLIPFLFLSGFEFPTQCFKDVHHIKEVHVHALSLPSKILWFLSFRTQVFTAHLSSQFGILQTEVGLPSCSVAPIQDLHFFGSNSYYLV